MSLRIFFAVFIIFVTLQTNKFFTKGESTMSQKNVFGSNLMPCSTRPMTGWYRDGYCRTDTQDHGLHTVCATMTREFLEYTKSLGNDLSTPNQYFPGLKPGDSWCLCSSRWEQARRAGKAPRVKLEATNEVALRSGISVETLQLHVAPNNNQASDGEERRDSCSSDGEICER